jgi:hypothetical protein
MRSGLRCWYAATLSPNLLLIFLCVCVRVLLTCFSSSPAFMGSFFYHFIFFLRTCLLINVSQHVPKHKLLPTFECLVFNGCVIYQNPSLGNWVCWEEGTHKHGAQAYVTPTKFGDIFPAMECISPQPLLHMSLSLGKCPSDTPFCFLHGVRFCCSCKHIFTNLSSRFRVC